MTYSLQDKRVVLIGSGSGIGAVIAADLATQGAHVVLAGRHPDKLASLVSEIDGVESSVAVDLTNETSIETMAQDLRAAGPVDHVVNLAASPPQAAFTDLVRRDIVTALDAKVVGPLLVAKHLSAVMPADGSFVFFSGIAAWRPSAGLTVMATANGAVSFLASSLAVELAPIRVNTVAPGIIDSGVWDRLGERKAQLFDRASSTNPARRIGASEDVSAAVLMLLTNPFITGETLHVDGGARFA